MTPSVPGRFGPGYQPSTSTEVSRSPNHVAGADALLDVRPRTRAKGVTPNGGLDIQTSGATCAMTSYVFVATSYQQLTVIEAVGVPPWLVLPPAARAVCGSRSAARRIP